MLFWLFIGIISAPMNYFKDFDYLFNIFWCYFTK